ncbi:MAG: hypothetical protein ABW196_11345 [Solirubrobacterales bacterium]
MASTWRRWAIGLLGWLVGPGLVFGAVTGIAAFVWAALAGLPAVIVALVAFTALTCGIVLAHYAMSLYDRRVKMRERSRDSKPSREPPFRPGDLARQHTSLGTGLQGSPKRIYGGAAIGEAIRRNEEAREKEATLLAVEAEIALSYEEALEMAKILRAEPPHTAVESAVVKTMLPDWRAKTREFVNAALGSAQRAAFKGAGRGSDVLEQLESEGAFLRTLALDLSPEAVRANETDVLNARTRRRGNEAAGLFDYGHSQTPGALPATDLVDRLDVLIREGIDLLDELLVPAEPEKTKGGNWKLEGGDAPDEWWEKADVFATSIRELLIERHPALLTDFRDGFNRQLEKERDTQEARNAKAREDKRSTAKKMLDLVNFERGGPARVVEASLEGLAAARHRLGARNQADFCPV